MFQLVLNLKTLIITAIVAVVLVGGLLTKTYYSGYTAGKEACELNAAKEAKKLEDEYKELLKAEQEKNEGLAVQLSEKKEIVTTITKVVTRYVTKEIEKPIYRECIVPDSGVRLRNEAATKYNSSRTGTSVSAGTDSTLQTPATSGRNQTPDDGRIAGRQLEPYGAV